MKDFRRLQRFCLKHWDFIFATIIILLLFFIYMQRFENAPGDGTSDYLVANHIVKYHELPLVGPYNSGTNEMVRYSPLYYFLLAGFLLIHNDIYFFGVVNALFLCVTFISLYLLAYFSFGRTQAVISLVLLSVSPYFFDLSRYIWQPHAMIPFVYLSYLLLLMSYTKKRFSFLVASAVIMSIALTIHFAVFSILPLYVILALLSLKAQKEKVKRASVFLAVSGATIVFLNLPSLVFSLRTMPENGQFMILAPSALVLQNIVKNFMRLFRVVNFESIVHPLQMTRYVLSSLLVVTIIKFLSQTKWSLRNKVMLSMIIASSIAVFASALTRNNYPVYLLPVIGFIPVMLAEVIHTSWLKGTIKNAIKAWILFLFVLLSLTSIALNSQWNNHRPKSFDTAAEVIAKIVSNEEIAGVSTNNFQVILYNNENFSNVDKHVNTYIPDSALIVPLENKLNTKLVILVNQNNRYRQTNTNDYIFFLCLHSPSMLFNTQCRRAFTKSYGEYTLHESVYSDNLLSVYPASKSTRMVQR